MPSRPTTPSFEPLPDHDDLPVDAVGEPLDAADDTSPQGAEGRRAFRHAARVPVFALGLFAVLAFAAAVVSGPSLRAAAPAGAPPESAEAGLPVIPMDPGAPFTFRGLDIHPDRLYGRYFAGAFADVPSAADPSENHLADFRWRLDMFRKAYGVDDNFSVRVLDSRTGQTLEVYRLEAERDRYRQSGEVDWDGVNAARRTATQRLLDKWEGRGVPRSALVIRWGYADQTLEARDRDERYITYEVNLARRLGLSLLATEIGTVETFNQDWLVSSAGARSRYQMMPDILRMFDVETYSLPTASGGRVEVKEERHPLLAMEPSLMLVRAYANSVGHELPGVSAYHTGPGNIFKLYREFIRANPGAVNGPERHVSDAYMWGVTDGFERVDEVSSFGPHSRIYVLKAYGALRATEDQLIEPANTIRAERVRIRPGTSVQLSELLAALEPHQRRLTWGPIEGETMYERFRDLNPHMALPVSSDGSVPASGDVRLAAAAEGEPVRFFLPDGSASVLRRVGVDVLGQVETFDERTFLPEKGDRTRADRDYDRLVREVGQFGFTRQAQRRLERIHDELQALAAARPDSRYRQTQAKIARIHKSVWSTQGFRDLVAATEPLLSATPITEPEEADSTLDRPLAPMERLTPRPPRFEDSVSLF